MSNRRKFVLGTVLIALISTGLEYWVDTQQVSGKIVFLSGTSVIMFQFILTMVLAMVLKIYSPKQSKKSGEVVEDKNS